MAAAAGEARRRGDGSGGDGEARRGHWRRGAGGDGDRVAARGREPARARSAPEDIGGVMVTTDTAALRAAAQASRRRDRGRRDAALAVCLSGRPCGAPPSCGGCCSRAALRQIVTERAGAASFDRSDGDDLDGSAEAAREGEDEAHFSARERERRLSTARIVASDAELIAQAVAAGRVRRVSPGIRG